MLPAKYLFTLRRHASQRIYKLCTVASAAGRLRPSDADKLLGYVVIEGLNTWANFQRAYFLSCVIRAWKEDGLQITLSNPTVRTFSDGLGVCMQTCKPWVWARGSWQRRDEPPWHDPQTLIRAASAIGCSHYLQIVNAFSIGTGVFAHLPTFRNFYAHRNDDTARKARAIALQYSIPCSLQPTQILWSPGYGSHRPLILDWFDDLNIVLGMLCA